MIAIKFMFGEKAYMYEPQPDITAYEAALLSNLILVSLNAFVDSGQRLDYINKFGLLRHFREVSADE